MSVPSAMSASIPNIREDSGGLRARTFPRVDEDLSSGVNSALSTPDSDDERAGTKDDEEAKDKKERKTIGFTPAGTSFIVPRTHDMVSQLIDPRQPKNITDILVLVIMALHMLALYLLPGNLKQPVFAVIFIFWRGCYNAGIGYLLHIQSHYGRLVSWARRMDLFENPNTGRNPRPWLYRLIKRELEAKIPEDYKFEEAPIEYNTWLVFRRVVDLILMCDFTSYCLFAIACGTQPAEGLLISISRWGTGILLVGFNLWVKLDAHRVVKDYAWYWGDFFYRIDQKLTFDGVFEMAPHPMYSVGYAGYYGISMMAASYSVLFISIAAHLSQWAFLEFVEEPHIERTYNQPPPRKHLNRNLGDIDQSLESVKRNNGANINIEPEIATPAVKLPFDVHNLIGLENTDLFRNNDVSILLIQVLVFIITVITPSTLLVQTIFVLNALWWRLVYSVGMGIILSKQSSHKMWTRHFLKFGDSADEAWRQWKGMYHLVMILSYASFIAAAWKVYSFPTEWASGYVLLKHVFGTGLIALQMWTASNIYKALGEFGWFFGDFFFENGPKLTYTGIYRYFNNPERFIGMLGIWGTVFITSSKAIFFLALVSHILSFAFLEFVEKPHMQKLYAGQIRSEAGFSKSIRRALPTPLRKWQGSVDKVLNDTGAFVEDFLEAARPKLATGVSTIVRDTSALFSQYPARLTVTRLSPDLAGFDPRDYSIKIEGVPSSALNVRERAAGKEGHVANLLGGRRGRRDEYEPLMFEYGTPIRVKWTAPVNHDKGDWVGLYKVADNASREVTQVSSAGRWVATVPNKFESSGVDKGILVSDAPLTETNEDGSSDDLVQGEMIFEGDKLFWTTGVFEFRYHHARKHNVMAISLPFEVQIGRFDQENVEVDSNGLIRTAIEQALLPLVQNCLDRDPEIAPDTIDESFGALVERDVKYAKRVVFAAHQKFGIELDSRVVLADGNVRNLAWRICNAKQVVAPYSMTHSNGTSTPIGEK